MPVSRAKSSSEVKGARARAATMRSAQSSASPSSFLDGPIGASEDGALAISASSFRGAPLGASPESILPMVVDSGLALRAPRNDDGEKAATSSDAPIGASGNDDGEKAAPLSDTPVGESRNDACSCFNRSSSGSRQ